jgi:hypothetical protein
MQMLFRTLTFSIAVAGIVATLLWVASPLLAHDGPRRQWFDWDDNGDPVVLEEGAFWGMWQTCFDTGSCSTAYTYHTFTFRPRCESVTNSNLNSSIASQVKDGKVITSWKAECSETPVADGWPDDPNDPCIHPRNWWPRVDECRPEIDAWLAKADGEPAPTPDPIPEPDPTPEPDPVPDPDPAPDPEPQPDPAPTPDPDPVPEPDPDPVGTVGYTFGTLDVGSINMVVRWTIDEPATGQTEYGTTPTPDDTWKVHGPELTFRLDHAQNIGGARDPLTPGTQYYYRISGMTADGKTYQSEIRSVSTTN